MNVWKYNKIIMDLVGFRSEKVQRYIEYLANKTAVK
jgi:ribonucleotide reductase beta subunit family protein with ferritin-like domain